MRGLPFKRARKRLTNYKKRIRLLSGKTPRIVIRRFLKNISVQIIDYKPLGDIVLVNAHSRELIKFGWHGHRGNTASAYMVGLLCGTRALKKHIKKAIPDIGTQPSVKGSVIYAALKGALDAGLEIPCKLEELPTEIRIKSNYQNFEQLKDAIIKEKTS